jgi:hypothetical protein
MTHLHWSWAWGFMTDWDTPSRDAHRPERADSRRRVKHAADLGRTQSVDGGWDSLCPRPSTKCATSRRTGTTPSTCRHQLGAVTHGGMRTEASSTASKSWFPAYGSPRPGPVMGCQVPAFTGLWSRPAAGLDAPAARRTDGERNCAWPYLLRPEKVDLHLGADLGEHRRASRGRVPNDEIMVPKPRLSWESRPGC